MAMSPGQIVTHVNQRLTQSDSSQLRSQRREAWKSYDGQPYAQKSRGGRRAKKLSQYTTREVYETVKAALPPLLKTFRGSRSGITFQPTGAGQIQLASMQTELVNALVISANGSYHAMRAVIEDALIFPVAFLKVQVERVDTPMPLPMYRLVLECIPGNEVVVDEGLPMPDLDMAQFLCHRPVKTIGELMLEGYSYEDLRDIGGSSATDPYRLDYTNRTQQMGRPQAQRIAGSQSNDPVMREINVKDCYMWLNMGSDRDPLPEYRRVLIFEDTLIDIEVPVVQPLIGFWSNPPAHGYIQESTGMAVMSLQKLVSQITGQLILSAQFANFGKTLVPDSIKKTDGSTDRALRSVTAKFVPTRANLAHNPPVNLPTQPFAGDLLETLMYFRGATPQRSGVTLEKPIRPEVLANAKANVFLSAVDKVGEQIFQIALDLAEMGFTKLYHKVYSLALNYPSLVMAMAEQGRIPPMDVSGWPVEPVLKSTIMPPNMTQLLQFLESVWQKQMQLGPAKMVSPEQQLYTLGLMNNAMGIGGVENFFSLPMGEPDKDPVAEGQARVYHAEADKVQGEVEWQRIQNASKRQTQLPGDVAEVQKIAAEARKADAEAKQTRDGNGNPAR